MNVDINYVCYLFQAVIKFKGVHTTCSDKSPPLLNDLTRNYCFKIKFDSLID